ncbi:hypothetical protein CU254_41725 (plasmid) [Amycolatopsis sp. AA4]|uniref:hypothetical protein n=1 Tax=Actinomycetes TaxID=1760 RepID=UPI0001B5516A|nr:MULTISPECIES: hypothetical protein [Actinomycetes]ATY17099.1 hypothetical protein CU254_41725 [Amycolatopsis sp. AA4]EFL12394.1 predicted protein [Streptomyces sp. AA4]
MTQPVDEPAFIGFARQPVPVPPREVLVHDSLAGQYGETDHFFRDVGAAHADAVLAELAGSKESQQAFWRDEQPAPVQPGEQDTAPRDDAEPPRVREERAARSRLARPGTAGTRHRNAPSPPGSGRIR